MDIREMTTEAAKEFKACWIKLAQVLYGIHRDKQYEDWGFKSFEQYTTKELNIKKSLAMKIVKTYVFVEDWEPQLLEKDYLEKNNVTAFPDFESVDFLRRMHGNKHLNPEEFTSARNRILEKHEPLQFVRQDLTALIKERKEESSDEARDKRHKKAAKKFIGEFRSFKKEAETLKILPAEILKKATDIVTEIESFFQ